MSDPTRVVFDCNTFLQAIASPAGPAGRCVQLALDGRVTLFVSPAVFEELRDVTGRPKVIAKLKLVSERVEAFFDSLAAAATLLDGFPEPFTYERDPDDAHYVNLALAADARLIVTRDKDLLDLMEPSTTEARDLLAQHPDFRVLTPPQFLAMVDPTPAA